MGSRELELGLIGLVPDYSSPYCNLYQSLSWSVINNPMNVMHELCMSLHLAFSHLHRCRELEEARERSVAEQVSYQELVETLQRALQEQEALLAEKVC